MLNFSKKTRSFTYVPIFFQSLRFSEMHIVTYELKSEKNKRENPRSVKDNVWEKLDLGFCPLKNILNKYM